MQLNTLKRKNKNKKERVIGRGGKHAKTAGRGTKGQNARSGHKKRPEVRDAIKKIPKLRGHGKNRAHTVNATKDKTSVVSLMTLEKYFDNGSTITKESLVEMGLVKTKSGKMPVVKILGTGTITKKFTVSGLLVSESAKTKIEGNSGSVSA